MTIIFFLCIQKTLVYLNFKWIRLFSFGNLSGNVTSGVVVKKLEGTHYRQRVYGIGRKYLQYTIVLKNRDYTEFLKKVQMVYGIYHSTPSTTSSNVTHLYDYNWLLLNCHFLLILVHKKIYLELWQYFMGKKIIKLDLK